MTLAAAPNPLRDRARAFVREHEAELRKQRHFARKPFEALVDDVLLVLTKKGEDALPKPAPAAAVLPSAPPTDIDLVEWVARNRATLRLYPHLATAGEDELLAEARSLVAAGKLDAKRLKTTTLRPPPTAGDLARIEKAQAKRARRGHR